MAEMVVIHSGEDKSIEITPGEPLNEVLQRLGYHPSQVLPFVGDEPIPLDTPVVDGGRVEVILITSGG